MITITVSPQSAAQMGVLADALKKMLEGLQPPETPPTREEMDAAQAQADAIQAKLEETPAKKRGRPAKTESPVDTQPAAAPAVSTEPTAPVTPATESPSEAVTIEEVRAKLATISQAGKGAAVRDLIKRVGGSDKLSEVPAEKYAALLAEAAAL